MARAVSTVLDVALCLLLVGVAASTLALAIPDQDQPVAVDSDSSAKTLTTVTEPVSTGETRKSHTTLAEHLARSAVVATTLDGSRLTDSPYPSRVERTIEERTDDRIYVTARWVPYSNASIESRRSAGERPPSTADVTATKVTIDNGMRLPNRIESFESLAVSIAKAYVYRLFPPERTRVRLVDSRTAKQTANRYRTVGRTVGVPLEEAIDDASPRRANERLANELAIKLERDLRAEYETPEAARSSADLDAVEIVVRRWEP